MMVRVNHARDHNPILQCNDLIRCRELGRQFCGLPDPLNDVSFHVDSTVLDLSQALVEGVERPDILQMSRLGTG
jgi:hypothetical protein